MRLVRSLGAGALAGAVGTAAMDLLLYARYRRDGGKDGLWRWEFAGDVMSWDEASAPGQLGRKALREVTGDEPPDEWARPATNIVHWATGIGWGALYGALASTTSRQPWTRGTRARSGRLALRLCRASAGEGLQADLGVRRADARPRICPRTSCTARSTSAVFRGAHPTVGTTNGGRRWLSMVSSW